MASVTVNLTGYGTFTNGVEWLDNVSLGSTFDPNGIAQELTYTAILSGSALAGQIQINLVGVDDRFTAAFEATGRIIFTASDGETLEVMIANEDMTEPYAWVPVNSAEVIAFGNHVRGLSNNDATLTLTDDPAPVAPSFADTTGDAQVWPAGTAITPITVPEASGAPAPTYAVVGAEPTGISFDPATRVLSGTPETVESSTITIRATNSEGTADWTVAYQITGPTVPSIPNIYWFVGYEIAEVLPIGTGSGTLQYGLVDIPNSLAFNDSTRTLSGTPPSADLGSFNLTYTVEDEYGNEASTTFDLFIEADFSFPAGQIQHAKGVIVANSFLEWYRSGQSPAVGRAVGDFTLQGAGDKVLNRFRIEGDPYRLTLNGAGGDEFRDHFPEPTDAGVHTYSDQWFHIKIAGVTDTVSVQITPSTVADAGGGFVRFNVDEPADETTLDNIVANTRLIFAMSGPPTAVAHTVDAGDVGWSFAVPQPTVTHIRPHMVDAGDVAWTFAVPEPSVTHTLRVPDDHQVNAGDVAWTFAVSQATVTHNTPPATVDHSVDAGDVSWSFAVLQPTVTHTITPVITGLTARSEGRSSGSIAVSYENLAVGDSLYIRYRDAGSSITWTTSTATVTSMDGVRNFLIAGLAAGTSYDIEASLASDYSSPQSITLDHVGTIILLYDVTDDDLWEIGDIRSAVSVASSTSRLGALPSDLDDVRSVEEVDGWMYLIQNTNRGLWRSRDPLDLTSYALLGVLPPATAEAHSIFAIAGEMYGMTSNSIFRITDPLDPSTAGPVQPLNSAITVARGSAVIGSTLYVWDHDGKEFWVIPDISTPAIGTAYSLVGLPANFDVRGMTTFNGRLITQEEDQTDLYEILGFTGTSPSIVKLGDYDAGARNVNAIASWSGNPGSVDFAVDAGNVLWSFAVPQPSVTHTLRVPVDHAVDAGDVAWSFTVPQPTITHTPPQGGQSQVIILQVGTGNPGQRNLAGELGDTGTLIDPVFVAGGVTSYLRQLFIAAHGINCDLRTSPTLSAGIGNEAGPDFTTDFEQRGTLTIDLDSHELVLTGIGDATEPYVWQPSNQSEIEAWLAGVSGTSVPTASVTLFLRDVVAHAVDAGDVAWSFAVPQPTVTTGVDHQVDAGDVAWTFAVPEPTVTYTPRVPVDHTVDAGDVAWSFAVPEPSVTHTRSHAVDAGDVGWSFAVPQPTVTHTARVPDDHQVDAGDASWTFAVPEPSVTHTLRVPDDHAVDAGDASWTFAVPEPTVTHTLRVPVDHQVDAGDVAWSFAVPQPTVTRQSLFGVNAGDVSWSFAVPEPTVTYTPRVPDDHAVDAGDVAWGFTVPQPTVTRRSSHGVDAGDVAWSFAVPQPTVTHVPLVTTDHQVNAGDVGWTFTVPQPTVTHTARVPDDHTVNAGDVAWSFAVPEPSVTHNRRHAVNAGDVGWIFAVPQPSVTHTLRGPVDHQVDAGDVAWTFAVPEPTVTHSQAAVHTVDAGDVAWSFTVRHPRVRHVQAPPPPEIIGDVPWFISYNTLAPTADARTASLQAIRDRVLSAVGAWRGLPEYGTTVADSIRGGTIQEGASLLESEIRQQLARDAALYTVDDVSITTRLSVTTLTILANDIEFRMTV